MGERLYCSPATVKAHLANIYAQLQITNRVRLAVLGHEAGFSGAAEGPCIDFWARFGRIRPDFLSNYRR
ncbi:LuxR C-terminal-related transcriptional regulator [Corynebacterium yudongzhengii]|uniref:LuxR C-terminal-related transcriptional regulator n=1 Tax=Corynebacterium yudongzhengii TaxID=2080740 RepID=UPI001F288C3C|nr:LuxR C-terminal-related transcriptional regulator [Corynebacterium yudongzhengii]